MRPASQPGRLHAMATLLLLYAFGILLSACIPQVPTPDTHDSHVAQAQTERAIAILPGVRHAAVTATAAVVTIDATANSTAITADVAKVTGLPPHAIVVHREPTTTVLLHMGPWILAAKSRWHSERCDVMGLGFGRIDAQRR